MSIFQTIHDRRSIKEFTPRSVSREEIEQLLEAVTQAPNHRMTEPWRFYVLGPEARHAYGTALGSRKARRVEDPEAAEAVIRKVARAHEVLPCMIAIALVLDENPEVREEDYAAVFMGLQNLSLAAHHMGLGAHIKSGAIMEDPLARLAVGVADGERIVATVHIGEPAQIPEQKPRKLAVEFTSWVG